MRIRLKLLYFVVILFVFISSFLQKSFASISAGKGFSCRVNLVDKVWSATVQASNAPIIPGTPENVMPFQIKQSIPQIANPTTPSEFLFNKAVTSFAEKLWEGLGGPPRSNPSRDDYQDVDLEWSKSTDSLPCIIGISFSMSQYTHGAAQGNFGFTNYNWLLKKARPIEPQDLFDSSKDWQQVLAVQATAALRRQSNGVLPMNSSFYPGSTLSGMMTLIADPAAWSVTADGLKITFNEGGVGGYDYGSPFVIVAWPQLKSVLKSDGLIRH